jgi:hypothetical protein
MASLRVIGRKMQKRGVHVPIADRYGGPEDHHHRFQRLAGRGSGSALNPRIIKLGVIEG